MRWRCAASPRTGASRRRRRAGDVAVRAARGAPPAHEPLRRRLPGLLHRRVARGRAERVGPRRVDARDRRARRRRRVPRRARRRRERDAAVARRARRSRAARAASCRTSRRRASTGLDRAAADRRPVRSDQRLARRPRRRPTPRSAASTASRAPTPRSGALRAVEARDRHQRRRDAPQLRRARRRSSRTPPSAGSSEVELLRFKPSGRGARAYDGLRCTDAQHRAFLPTILAAARRHRVRVKVDCSYTPMLAHHRPGPRAARRARGLRLHRRRLPGRRQARRRSSPRAASRRRRRRSTATARGSTSSRAYWNAPDAFGAFRTLARRAPSRARAASYHALCRGGCKVVSAHVTGDARRARSRVPARDRPRGCDRHAAVIASP